MDDAQVTRVRPLLWQMLTALLLSTGLALGQVVDAPASPSERKPESPQQSGGGAPGAGGLPPAPAKAARPDVKAVAPPGETGLNLDKLVRYSATGLALPNAPVEPGLNLTSNRATAWRDPVGDYLLLEGDVALAIGSYAFKADRALAVVQPRPYNGIIVRDIALYMENVRELGGYGPITQSAGRLLVTAVVKGKVSIETSLMKPAVALNDPLVAEGIARINRQREAVIAATINAPGSISQPLVAQQTFIDRAQRRGEPLPLSPSMSGAPGSPGIPGLPGVPGGMPPAPEKAGGVPPSAAQVDFHAGKIVYKKADKDKGETEGHVLLLGGVQVMAADPKGTRRVNLVADKAVIFLDESAGGGLIGDESNLRSAAASKIKGVYLEDNVMVTDGQYSLRGPRVFYDLSNDKAVVLEAVFFTWDAQHQIPLYVRAREIRQESNRQWSAYEGRVTTSEFYEPHFSIGARTMTITAGPAAPGAAPIHTYTAEGVTMNVLNQPIFYWPKASGDTTEIPLQAINVGYESRRGLFVETRWDLFALANQPKIQGVNASLLADAYSSRGAAVGIDAEYDVHSAFGSLEGKLFYDDGEDDPSGREKVDPDNNFRGFGLWRHRHELGDDWEASLELAYVSDPSFLEEWRRDDAYAAKEYETSIYLKQQREDWAFTFLAKTDLQDFVPQSDLLQTVGNANGPTIGYTVQKFPELAYYRIGTPLWDNHLTWFSENRASAMRIALPEDRPLDRGFTTAQSVALFGIAPTVNFDDALHAGSIDEHTRFRGDTRQEIDAPIQLGIFNLTPYVVGRVTAYDDDFAEYGGESDNLRLWGGGGIRGSTAVSRAYDSVQSPLLDLHRLRHVVEPYFNLLYAETSIKQQALPVYDYEVESLAEGGVYQFGLRNTLQTQRGGEGNWRSVDWIKLDTRFITGGNARIESPFAHFFEDRPELSTRGEHLTNDLAIQASDTLRFYGEVDYSFESDQVERWNAGLALDHTPRLTTFVNLREIDYLNSLIVRYGVEYLLTPKYHVAFAQTFDIHEGTSRNVDVVVTRRLPRWLLIAAISFDTIDESTSVGVALAPEGFAGKGNVGRNPFTFKQ